jgi:hypothetical protein
VEGAEEVLARNFRIPLHRYSSHRQDKGDSVRLTAEASPVVLPPFFQSAPVDESNLLGGAVNNSGYILNITQFPSTPTETPFDWPVPTPSHPELRVISP